MGATSPSGDLPEVIAGFRIVSLLGRGATGTVMLAEHPDHGQVALKLLDPTLAADPVFAARFDREATILAGLRHPHLAGYIAHGRNDQRQWLAMEYVPGPTLADLIAHYGRLGEADVLRMGLHVARALGHVWDHATLIHRDIKPGNILVADGQWAKIIDFGLARSATDATDVTMAGAIIGTPAYMAPEQIRGQTLDFRTDIYALGGTLFHLITGRMPYPDPVPMRMLQRQLADPVPDPAGVAHMSPLTAALIRDCLAKEPRQRPLSHAQIASRLRAILLDLGEPEQAPLDLQLAAGSDVVVRRSGTARLRQGSTSQVLRPQTEGQALFALEHHPLRPSAPAVESGLPWWWWLMVSLFVALDVGLAVLALHER